MEGKGKVGRRIGKGRGGRERETEAGRWVRGRGNVHSTRTILCITGSAQWRLHNTVYHRYIVHNGDWLLAVADTVSERFVTTNY